MTNNTERFSDRVDNYIKYRPGYPPELIPYLCETIGLTRDWVVADIGSGTGISTELFLIAGHSVYAVEPNTEMRDAAEGLLCEFEGLVSVNGSSEATTLAAGSVDLIVAAQAFHLFDRAAFRSECRRIGRPDAYCLLIWNERRVVSGFEIAYEGLLSMYATDYSKVDHRNIQKDDMAAFFAPEEMLTSTFRNQQVFDYEGVKGRLLSSSYAPNVGHVNYEPMLTYLREIFDAHQSCGRVSFTYDCNLYLGKVA
jgi:SAM-dependent methyltransferase